jgi:pimeloyl-ACP methyl ester carboxylesterase
VKRREMVLAGLGVILLLAGAREIPIPYISTQQTILDDGCRTPITMLTPLGMNTRGSIIVFHGLSANRRIMLRLGEQLTDTIDRVYLLDLPGHGDSTEPFSFARAEECAARAVATLARRGEINPDTTTLVGHSMGGAIAIRLADHFPVLTTVAISPAPIVLPRRMPSNLLVFSAQYDLPILKRAATALAQAAGGDRKTSEDFRQRRAFELDRVSRATHTSLLYDPGVLEQTIEWIKDAFHPEQIQTAENKSGGVYWNMVEDNEYSRLRPRPLLGSVLGLCGLFLLFPLSASLCAMAFCPVSAGFGQSPSHGGLVILRWLVATLFSVCVLNYVVPLRALRIFTGDYLASLLLLAGTVLCALTWKEVQPALAFPPRAMAMAAVLGFAAFLVVGGWLNWHVTYAWMNGARWLRFVFLVPLLWPYCFAEEIALGAPPKREEHRPRMLRFVFFLLLRLILWLACIFALFLFASGQILILLLGLYFAAFSIVQRLCTDAIRRRTGSPTAAALFGAILAAWFIAVVFPLT